MINRIFKTILVLSLCVGISLPTNAAVSVSDGSAFVTKAEFAADLNNLSSRMAQLENSLDAKIDSLVSSYLTRNGIWNGAKQTMTSNVSGRMGVYQDGVTKINVSAQGYEGASPSTESKYKCFTYDDDSVTIINSVSKTGLLVIKLEFNQNTQDTGGRVGIDLVDNESNKFPVYHFGTLTCGINLINKTGSENRVVYSWNTQKQFNSATKLTAESSQTTFAMFFTSKNDDIIMSYFTDLNVSGGSVGGWNTTSAKWFWLCTVSECYIY